MEVIFEDALILLHEKKISSLREMVPLLEKVAQSGKTALDLLPRMSRAKPWRHWW